ncbi:MAG: glutamate synthase subunit beta [Leadbetterella sp.]|nr:glutamate synthase subunit beta [Leadbetterella sp.]
MGKPSGFLEFERQAALKRGIEERRKDYREVEQKYSEKQTSEQATRCMDCGVPFCHSGCPLGNNIPDFNDAIYEGNWKYAFEILDSTNNFPEFTGRICPAPCESACVLGINKNPVAIEYIEKSIIEKAFENGWVTAHPPKKRNDKKVAVIGSGPAGLAAASQLNKAGYRVTVFERADQVGGLLRYGIPDFKLEKQVIDRRLKLMEEEGVIFRTGVNVGTDISAAQLQEDYDAVLLAIGSTLPRTLEVEGKGLNGVHFAMDYLTQQNKRVALEEGYDGLDLARNHAGEAYEKEDIRATGKKVFVIGGGDTGSDCVGTANRQGAERITQIAYGLLPPTERDANTPWPMYEHKLRTSTSHEEGCERLWSVNTKEFIGDENGNLKALRLVEVSWKFENGKRLLIENPASERLVEADIALLAIGFSSPQVGGLVEDLDLKLDARGNIVTEDYRTSRKGVFAAGDCKRGQSLVVWAISEGREAARAMDVFLSGSSVLEAKEVGMTSAAFSS